MKAVRSALFAFLSSALTLGSCALDLAGTAKKYGLPAEPFDAVLLQVYDLSRDWQGGIDSRANLVWNLHLTDAEWVNHLGSTLSVQPPGAADATALQDVTILKDSDGAPSVVRGLWREGTGQQVTFGTYGVTYTVFDESTGRNGPSYTDTFVAKAPDGSATGKWYTDNSAGQPKLADVTDFAMTMYSDGLAFTITEGSLSRADLVVLDLYRTASIGPSTFIAEIVLDAQAEAGMRMDAAKTIIVKPQDLAALYAANAVTTATPSWFCEYYTIDDPASPAANRTQYIYASGDASATNSLSSPSPNGHPVVTLDVTVPRGSLPAAGSAASFSTAAGGARPYRQALRTEEGRA